MFIRRVIKTTSDYICCMRQSYTDLTPLLALVGVVLTAGLLQLLPGGDHGGVGGGLSV
jgi:hypothetical protein